MDIKCQKLLCYMPYLNCYTSLRYYGSGTIATIGKPGPNSCNTSTPFQLITLCARKQKPDELGKEFMIELQTLMRRHGNVSADQILFHAYNNLLAIYRQYIRRRDFTSMRELMYEIVAYERIQAELRCSKPTRITALETPAAPQSNEVNTPPAPGGRLQRRDNPCFRCTMDTIGSRAEIHPENSALSVDGWESSLATASAPNRQEKSGTTPQIRHRTSAHYQG